MSGSRDTLRERLVRALEKPAEAVVRRAGCEPAAVLVPLLLDAEVPELLFTRRTDDVETHKGQVSFPGGVCDESDRGPVDTALRETEEELGIPRRLIDVVGCLPELKTPTGFCITPVVGMLRPCRHSHQTRPKWRKYSGLRSAILPADGRSSGSSMEWPDRSGSTITTER
jgi:8-oxo-dGTP pyrophosphatase MutT (NUDIX family)